VHQPVTFEYLGFGDYEVRWFVFDGVDLITRQYGDVLTKHLTRLNACVEALGQVIKAMLEDLVGLEHVFDVTITLLQTVGNNLQHFANLLTGELWIVVAEIRRLSAILVVTFQ
jgi:hypothetical protein